MIKHSRSEHKWVLDNPRPCPYCGQQRAVRKTCECGAAKIEKSKCRCPKVPGTTRAKRP